MAKMTVTDFCRNTLEEARLRDLQVGDIFSFATYQQRHQWIREVIQKDEIYTVISKAGYTEEQRYSTKTNSPVTRIVRGKEYDPKQQPYEDGDI